MALTPSSMLALGTAAPDFALVDVISGKTVRLADFADRRALAVLFICNHCPYVKHIREGLVSLARHYSGRSVGIVAINANDPVHYPDDAPEKMKVEADAAGFSFPYLFDATQEIAKAYHATCTPDLFLFDARRHLVYRGQFDDSRPGNGKPVTGADFRKAIDAVLEGHLPSPDQKPSIGCNIKWKPGSEPND